MSDLLYKEECFQLVGYCMEIHTTLGQGHDEVIYKDSLAIELQNNRVPYAREK
jgi:GxxExxY protein